jgi:hypothetical protein
MPGRLTHSSETGWSRSRAAAFVGVSDLDDASAIQMTKAWRLVQKTPDISLAQLTSGIAAESHISVADRDQTDLQSAVLIPAEVAHGRNVLPLSCTGKNVSLATANPLSQETKKQFV